MKSNLLYFLIVIIFSCFFILTQRLDTQTLYLGFADPDSGSVYHNHKTSFQTKIFVYVLAITLTVISFLRIVKQRYFRIGNRIMINVMIISVIYLVNYYLSKIVPSEGFNIYGDWKHNRGFGLAIFTMIINAILVILTSFITNWIAKNWMNGKINN